MKNLAELKAIQDKTRNELGLDQDNGVTRILVGMATCGIAAGANPVMDALQKEISDHALKNVTVSQTGCIGICQYEPVIEVFAPGKEKVTYVKMDAKKASRVMEEHVTGGHIVVEYTIGAE